MNEEFMRLFLESQPLTAAGLLKSSLEKLRAASLTASDRGWRALGKANEAIFLGEQLGDGLAAYEAAKESLTYIREFQAASEEFEKSTKLSIFESTLNIVRQWPESYEECIRLNHIRAEFLPSQKNRNSLLEIKNIKSQEPEWWRTQLGMAYNFYSRDRPELDRGLNAQAMSILQCLLRRALDESPGYNLTADKFEAVLQDYIFIGHKYLNALLLRYQFKRGFGTNQDKEEILAVAKNILDIWVEAAPDIPTQKKEIRKVYEEIFGFYWMFLAMFHAQDEMLQLTKYYEEAMMACPDCGKSIPKIAPICRYCIQPLTGMAKSLLKEADQEFGTSPSHRTTQVDFHQKSDWEDQSSYVQEYGVRVRKSCATRIFNVLVFMICTALFIFFLKTGYYDDIKTESNEFSLWSKRYQLVGTLVPLLGFACLFSEILDVILFFYYRRFKRYGGWK